MALAALQARLELEASRKQEPEVLQARPELVVQEASLARQEVPEPRVRE